MARWTKVITDEGKALIAAAPGKVFDFSRAACGSGRVDISLLHLQTSVSGEQKPLSITDKTSKENVSKLRLQLKNVGFTREYPLSQIGIYARLGNAASDILFMIIQADNPDTIPSEVDSPNFVNDYVVNITVDDAGEITATIDVAAYVTIGHLADLYVQMDEVSQKAEAAVEAAGNAASTDDLNALTGRFDEHAEDVDIHVDAEKKARWDGKAENTPATPTQTGLMTAADKSKLDGIAAGATNYVHPSAHPAGMITTDKNRRFVSDEQIALWNEKADNSDMIGVVSDVASIAFQLEVQQLLDTEGMKHVVVDVIDSASAVNIISGRYSNGKVMI